jgi:hypothetical protein
MIIRKSIVTICKSFIRISSYLCRQNHIINLKNMTTMNKKKRLFGLLAMLAAIVFATGMVTACGDDDDDDDGGGTWKPKGVSVSPTSVEFGAEGGKASVFIKYGSYSHYGADVRPEGSGWCKVSVPSGSNGEVIIIVSPNYTGASRSCIVDCHVAHGASEPESERYVMHVSVTQEANSQSSVSVSPSSLEFTAAGGEQNVRVSYGSYGVYGAQVRSEGKGWCGVSIPNNSQNGDIKVTVLENTTGKARECYIDFYVCQTSDSPESEWVKMPVYVSQQAGGSSGQGSEINKQISSITIYGEAAATSKDADVDKMTYGAQMSEKNANFKIVSNGNGAIITGKSFERVYNYLYDVTITIDNWANVSSNKAKITDFKLNADLLKETSYGATNKIAVDVNAKNIPMKGTYGTKHTWEGTVGGGMTLTAKTVSSTVYQGQTSSITTTSVNNSANNLSVEVYFKDGSKVRVAAH